MTSMSGADCRGRNVIALAACALIAAIAPGCGSSAQTSPGVSSSSATATATSTGGGAAQRATIAGMLYVLPRASETSAVLPPPVFTSTGEERRYLKETFDDIQRFWREEFARARLSYVSARLSLFTRAVHSACGSQVDSGPFYCGNDRTVYLDLSFMSLLARQSGRFGEAYVVGHELGHHIQGVLAIARRVALLDQRTPARSKARSVRVELQADCLAGVWAHSIQARGQLSPADLKHALTVSSIVGDDYQQRAAGLEIDSSLWTHGSSSQRQRWLRRGFKSGLPRSCDTFARRNA
jgi:uncharacterized protein